MAKRRGNQEGSICRRANGKWQAQMTIGSNRLTKTFGSRADCNNWLRKVNAQKDKGLTYQRANLTYGMFASDWLEVVKAKLRPTTIVQYQWVFQSYLIGELGNVKLRDLTPVTVQSLYAKLLQSGASGRTLQAVHAFLRRTLNVAERQGLVSSNPVKAVEQPGYEKPEMAVLSENQVRQLIITAAGTQLEVLVQLAVTTGMRKGELLGLRWTDVDWGSSTVKVRRQLQRVSKMGLVIAPPKTNRGIRTVQIGSETLGKLMRHRDQVGDRFPDVSEMPIFCSSVGTPIEPRNLVREFKVLLVKANLPNIRFHDLRHTAASMMLMNGMPVIKIARQLGHAKPSTTLDIYGHLIPGMDVEAVEKMDELVTPIAAELQQAVS